LSDKEFTLYVFTNDGCKSCDIIEPLLDDFLKEHPEVGYREIDIDDGKAPVVSAYNIEATPTLIVFDQNCEQVLRYASPDVEALEELLTNN